MTSITKLYSNPTVLKYFGHTNAGAATGWDGLNINNTAFNLPYSVSKPGGGIHYFTYDEAYQRVKYATPTNARVYFRSALGPTLYERDQPTGGATRHRLFIFGAGRQPVAQVTIVDATTQWHYLHHDRLGSITLITDQNAQTVERHYFDAYGKRRNVNGTDAPTGGLTSAVTSRGFTGHEHLDELNLIHMNGRIYDPYVGRFLSGDPVLHGGALAQGMNRYAYVRGNPMRYTDPTGFADEDEYAQRHTNSQNGREPDDKIDVTAPRFVDAWRGGQNIAGNALNDLIGAIRSSLRGGGGYEGMVNMGVPSLFRDMQNRKPTRPPAIAVIVGPAPRPNGGQNQTPAPGSGNNGDQTPPPPIPLIIPAPVADYLRGFGDGAYRVITFGQGDLEAVRVFIGISPNDSSGDMYDAGSLGGTVVGAVSGLGTLGRAAVTEANLLIGGNGVWYRFYPGAMGPGLGVDIGGLNLIRFDWHWINTAGRRLHLPHIDSRIFNIRHWPWPK